MPKQDGIVAEQGAPLFVVSVAHWQLVVSPGNASSHKPSEGKPSGVVQPDDQFSVGQRDIDPLCVGSIENPTFTTAHLTDALSLQIIAHLNPVGLPRKRIGFVPFNPGDLG